MVTDKIEDLHEDPVLNDTSMQAGENIGRTIEALNYGVIRAGTSVYYANGVQRTDVNTPITLSKQRAVLRSLKALKAQKITRSLSPSSDYGTRAVEAAYVAVAHTDVESDLRNMPGFKTVAEYGTRSSTVVLIGRDHRVVFVERSFGPNGVAAGEVSHEFALSHH